MDKIHGDANNQVAAIEETLFARLLQEKGRDAQLAIASWVCNNFPRERRHEELKFFLKILGLDGIRDEAWVFGPAAQTRHRPGGEVREDNLPRTMCNKIVQPVWITGGGGSRRKCRACVTNYHRQRVARIRSKAS